MYAREKNIASTAIKGIMEGSKKTSPIARGASAVTAVNLTKKTSMNQRPVPVKTRILFSGKSPKKIKNVPSV